MQLKHKLEIVIDALYERVLPKEVQEAFPEMTALTSTRFYRVYGCVLDRELSKDETRLLNNTLLIEETIEGFYCEQVLPEWQ